MKNVYGMENVTIEATNNNTYAVYADTKRFGKHEMMFESFSVEECLLWAKDNGFEFPEIDVQTPDAIDHIEWHSYLTDSFTIFPRIGVPAHKTGWERLTFTERMFRAKAARVVESYSPETGHMTTYYRQ